jgi:hypothetical protein
MDVEPKKGTMQYYSQPDYILVRATKREIFKGAGFRFLRFLGLDHCTIIAVVQARQGGRLKQYQHKCQKFLLSLPPGPKDVDTMVLNLGLSLKSMKRILTNYGTLYLSNG